MPTTFGESLWRSGDGKVQGNREKSGGKIVRRQSKNDLMTGIPGSLQETDGNNEMRFLFFLLDIHTRGDLHKYGH